LRGPRSRFCAIEGSRMPSREPAVRRREIDETVFRDHALSKKLFSWCGGRGRPVDPQELLEPALARARSRRDSSASWGNEGSASLRRKRLTFIAVSSPSCTAASRKGSHPKRVRAVDRSSLRHAARRRVRREPRLLADTTRLQPEHQRKDERRSGRSNGAVHVKRNARRMRSRSGRCRARPATRDPGTRLEAFRVRHRDQRIAAGDESARTCLSPGVRISSARMPPGTHRSPRRNRRCANDPHARVLPVRLPKRMKSMMPRLTSVPPPIQIPGGGVDRFE